MTSTERARQAAGQPTGGQFAATAGADAGLDLEDVGGVLVKETTRVREQAAERIADRIEKMNEAGLAGELLDIGDSGVTFTLREPDGRMTKITWTDADTDRAQHLCVTPYEGTSGHSGSVSVVLNPWHTLAEDDDRLSSQDAQDAAANATPIDGQDLRRAMNASYDRAFGTGPDELGDLVTRGVVALNYYEEGLPSSPVERELGGNDWESGLMHSVGWPHGHVFRRTVSIPEPGRAVLGEPVMVRPVYNRHSGSYEGVQVSQVPEYVATDPAPAGMIDLYHRNQSVDVIRKTRQFVPTDHTSEVTLNDGPGDGGGLDHYGRGVVGVRVRIDDLHPDGWGSQAEHCYRVAASDIDPESIR